MAHTYGFVKATILAIKPTLAPKRLPHETQYHLHLTLSVQAADGSAQQWDTAINVGTNDSDDLLQFKLVYDFQHPITQTLSAATPTFHDLTGTAVLPALDFLRSDILANTGAWGPTDPMDGSTAVEPAASLMRLFHKAMSTNATVYVFGRSYTGGDLGIHDIHMNQGSSGAFLNQGNDHNDHNDIWQDGGVIVDLGEPQWAAYFTAFNQQTVPTDDLGNPRAGGHNIGVADEDSQR